MKQVALNTILVISFGFGSFESHSQNRAIDSLLNVLQTQKEDSNKVNTLNWLAYRTGIAGDHKKGIEYSTTALHLSEKLNYKNGTADASQLLGYGYVAEGNFDEALKNFSIALKLFEEKENKGRITSCSAAIGGAYFGQGHLFFDTENYSEALKKYNEALKFFKRAGLEQAIADCNDRIQECYDNQ